jgi:hypothetical protein
MLPAFSVAVNMGPPWYFFALVSLRVTLFHRSGSPEKRDAASQGNITREADGYLVPVDYDRDLHPSPGARKHFLQFLRVFIRIDIDGPLTVGCPCLVAKRSGIRAVNDDLLFHEELLLLALV